jgi:A/G-specific adenine glycosylase
VLLRERPLKGLLGGMLETPSTPWEDAAPTAKSVRDHAPLEADWQKIPGLVEHTFTHFHLELSVYRAGVRPGAIPKPTASPDRCRWLKFRDLAGAALPSLMRKVISHAVKAEAKPAARADGGPPRARRRSA